METVVVKCDNTAANCYTVLSDMMLYYYSKGNQVSKNNIITGHLLHLWFAGMCVAPIFFLYLFKDLSSLTYIPMNTRLLTCSA